MLCDNKISVAPAEYRWLSGELSGLGMDPRLAPSKVPAGELGRKPMQGMMERDREHALDGWVQLDEASLGGERSGGRRGRGASGKCRSIRGRWCSIGVAQMVEMDPNRVWTVKCSFI